MNVFAHASAFFSEPEFMTLAQTLRSALFILWLGSGAVSVSAFAAPVTLNFVKAPVDQVAKAIGAATGKTIIVDPRVKGELNLVADEPVPEAQALKTLQSALRMQGFALVNEYGIWKVVPEADAKTQGAPVVVGNMPRARGDQIITQVFRLRHESANTLIPILRPLVAPNNPITAYPASNTIVITDYADNLRRIAAIIASIDTAASQQVEVVPVENANAIDVAGQLQRILDPGAIGNADANLRISVQADPRTNAVLLRASSAARLQAAKKLIAKLDTPTREPGNIHVVSLRHASAVQLAKTLRGVLGKGSGTGAALATSGEEGGKPGILALPPLPTGAQKDGLSGGPDGLAKLAGLAGLAGESKDASMDAAPGGVIQADPATNSLVITAPDPVYRNLRRVIDQLDQRRAQIYIESLIVEISSSDIARFGIQWQFLLGRDNVYAGTNLGETPGTNIIGLSQGLNQLAQGNPSGLTPPAPGLNIGYLRNFGKLFGLGGLLQALSALGSANVLSTPTMVTLDNETAKMLVGQNVPILVGSYAQQGGGTSGTPFQTFDRKDVGIVLNIKPQITEGGVIQLKIYQEDSNISSPDSPSGVILNKRFIQSTLLADDGQIVVLGGLLQDAYKDSHTKVPWLGDIPVIGGLFRYEHKNRAKTNLMVFLRPMILRDAHAAQRISLDRYDRMRVRTYEFESGNRILRDQDTPVMPKAPPSSTPEDGAPDPTLAPQTRNPAMLEHFPSLPSSPPVNNAQPFERVPAPDGWPAGLPLGQP
nr:type II secretion system secretin GspD [Candidatus Glomeribacter gigasporarum]